jgi:predicted small integral membrane protein
MRLVQTRRSSARAGADRQQLLYSRIELLLLWIVVFMTVVKLGT